MNVYLGEESETNILWTGFNSVSCKVNRSINETLSLNSTNISSIHFDEVSESYSKAIQSRYNGQ